MDISETLTYQAPTVEVLSATQIAAKFNTSIASSSYVASVTGNDANKTLTFTCQSGYFLLNAAKSLPSGDLIDVFSYYGTYLVDGLDFTHTVIVAFNPTPKENFSLRL